MRTFLLALSLGLCLSLAYSQHPVNPFSEMEDKIINAIPAELKIHSSKIIDAGNHPLSSGPESLLDSSYYWLWDTTAHTYMTDGREYYEYNGQQQLITIYYEDFEGGEWEISGRTSHTYNQDGLLDNTVFEFGFGGNYLPYARFYYIYDAEQRVMETGYQTYTAGQWKNLISIVDEYDASGNLISKTYRDWMTIAWVNDFRRVYAYDGENKLLTQTVQDWDSGWVNDEYFTYSYNPEGLLDERRDHIWSVNDWSLEGRQLFEYDAAGKLLVETTQDHISGDFWFNDNRVIMTYDAQGQLLTGTTQIFANNDWQNLDLLVFGYDSDNNNIFLVTQTWDSAWTVFDSSYYYYSMVSSFKEVNGTFADWMVSPNPVKEILYLNQADGITDESIVSIYSMEGVLLRAQKFNKGDVWAVGVNDLPASVYLVSIHSAAGKSSRLFVKE